MCGVLCAGILITGPEDNAFWADVPALLWIGQHFSEYFLKAESI